MQKHKHCDVIKKLADGWIVEILDEHTGKWYTFNETFPSFMPNSTYRAIHPDFPNEYKAWLEGKEIECRYSDGSWFIINPFEINRKSLIWEGSHEFRIKHQRNKELDEALYKAFLICKAIEYRAAALEDVPYSGSKLLYSIIGQ